MPLGVKPTSGPPAVAAAAVPDAVTAARRKQPSHGARKAELRRQAGASSGAPAKAVRASGHLQQAMPRPMQH
eukprot:352932-Chlamydomonas_euryale.AAC.5